MPQQLPQQFGRYQILRSLGSGGMGDVYLAHDTVMDSPVALKVPRLETDPSDRAAERFRREARVMFGLRHPNLCPVFDVGEIDGHHYLVMAYIEGIPLSDWLDQQEQIVAPDAAKLVSTIAQAIEVAHENNIVHRDLKPANIMMENGDVPVVMDFGLALQTNAADSRLTRTGVVLGTPAYMPIEQVMGETEKIGPRTDIYSLGVILYEMLCGRLPFEGGTTVVLGQIIGSEAPPLSEWNSSIGPALESVCMRALAKLPEDRYASMSEFAAALQSFCDQSPITQNGKSTGTSLFATVQPQPRPQPQPLSQASQSTSRKSLWDQPRQTSTKTNAAASETEVSLHDTTIHQPSTQPVARRRIPRLFGKWKAPLIATTSAILLTTLIVAIVINQRGSESSQPSSQPAKKSSASEDDTPLSEQLVNRIPQQLDSITASTSSGDSSPTSNSATANQTITGSPEITQEVRTATEPDPKISASHDTPDTASRSPESQVASLATNNRVPSTPQPIENVKPSPPLMRSPFDASQAKAGQKTWAEHLEMPTMKLNSTRMVLVLIPPGSFTMGSPRSEGDRENDENQVRVTLTKPFYLGQYEVTQPQWTSVMGTKPWGGQPTAHDGEYQAASYISWNHAKRFCQKLTDRERQAGQLPDKWAYSLPTEAQWEYACRAGTKTTYFFGNEEAQLKFYANYRDLRKNGEISKNSYQVGIKSKNAWGLADMHGNMREWCEDRYVTKLPGGNNPLVTWGTYSRISRGGSWTEPARFARSASRGPIEFDRARHGRKQYLNSIPDFQGGKNGFRLALVQTGS